MTIQIFVYARKGSEVLFQEQFRKMQNNLLPSSATVQIPVKFRMNHHKRSSSASKTDNGSSPCVLRPQKPIPLCPTRSKSFTAPERMPGTRDSLGERLSSSIEKARSSVNSEDTRQTSFISGKLYIVKAISTFAKFSLVIVYFATQLVIIIVTSRIY